MIWGICGGIVAVFVAAVLWERWINSLYAKPYPDMTAEQADDWLRAHWRNDGGP